MLSGDFKFTKRKYIFQEISKNLGFLPSAITGLSVNLKEDTHTSIGRHLITTLSQEHLFGKMITVSGAIMKRKISEWLHLTSGKTMKTLK